MTRILMIAPSCRGNGDPEAIVNAKFARALLGAGYELDVITAESRGGLYRYATAGSESDGLDNVCRSIAKPTARSVRNASWHLEALCRSGYLFKGIGWAAPAIVECAF